MSEVVLYLVMVGLALVALAALRQSGVDSADERVRDGER
jgi:hypothetical protein